MIVDAILYNGEWDIFNLRYGILKDYVDEFVVVEFSKTFSNKDKEVHPIYLPKVSYYYLTEWKDYKPDMPPAFQMEYSQREAIKDCLTHLDDNDIVFMGDCDEIWNPEILWQPAFKGELVKMPYFFEEYSHIDQVMYSYYLNNRTSEEWKGTIITTYGYLKDKSLNDLRSNKKKWRYGKWGWHFTNMGGVDKLKYKIESYGHQEFNTPEIKDNLENQIKENKDYIGRDYKMWIDEDDWPPWLKENREKFAHLLK